MGDYALFFYVRGEKMIAQDVFMIAMNLMDEISSDGTFAGYDDDYKKKAWPILTVLQTELLPLSTAPVTITDENSTLLVDDRTGLTVLPYGLAAHLLLNGNVQSASFFNDRYEELKRRKKATIASITDVYGVTNETD
jgi:hypothetical protein